MDGMYSVIWDSRKASRLSFNEKSSLLGNKSSAVRAQTGVGNAGSFFSLSYHNPLHLWSVCPKSTIQSITCGHTGGGCLLSCSLTRPLGGCSFSSLLRILSSHVNHSKCPLRGAAGPLPASLLACLDNICTEFSPFV